MVDYFAHALELLAARDQHALVRVLHLLVHAVAAAAIRGVFVVRLLLLMIDVVLESEVSVHRVACGRLVAALGLHARVHRAEEVLQHHFLLANITSTTITPCQ